MNHSSTLIVTACVALFCTAPLGRAAQDSEAREDCIPFNLDSVTVALVRGNWSIVDGGQLIFNFGGDEQQARRGLEVIHFYRMDSTCFAGRPNPPMVYLLASGKAPAGNMPGEHCEAFDASRISLSQSGESWKILSGTEVLFDFGNRERGAKQGMLALRHYEFNYQCIVGSTGSSFRYLRR